MRKRFLIVTLGLLLTGCGVEPIQSSQPSPVNSSTVEVFSEQSNNLENDIEIIETEHEVIEPVVEKYSLSLVAVGDNLIHSPIYNKARQDDGSYNFSPMYEDIKETIQSYDLAVINQETIFVEDESNISSYPCFGTPISIGDTLVDVGFDVVLNATNHTWDKRSIGWQNTIDFWKKYPEITVLGINENEEDFNTVDIVEKNGFKLAMFNYTYGLNGFTLPSDMQYTVNLLDYKDKFISDLQSVESDVDFSICFLHIGTEYTYIPTDYQVEYIENIIDAGADIVICSHPHVVEPYQEFITDNGNRGLVFYSCGNFISNQNEIPRILGGMAEINLIKTTTDGVVTDLKVSDYNFIPTVTHYNSYEHKVMLLEDYTDELASKHSLYSKGLSVKGLWNLWYDIISK